MDLTTPISDLTRVGKTSAKRLEFLGIKNVENLLYYFPFRYEDYRKILPISQLSPPQRDPDALSGQAGELVTICGQVELIANKRSFKTRKVITEALVSDKDGSVRVVWFNQPFIIKNIKVGDVLYLSGKVKTDMLGPQLVSPAYEKWSASSADAPVRRKDHTIHTARLVPIYPSTYGLTQKQIRFLISQVIGLADKIKDWLPKDILEQADLAPLAAALRGIHFPVDDNDLKLSTDRLKFDELFLVQLVAELARQEKAALQAPPIFFKEDKIKSFVASLPFALTRTQKISAWEILQDIAKTKPMNRLISGDVGSGKTVVAAIAMYDVFLNGYQAVMMAPTEILAQQHYQSLVKLFSGLGATVGLLTGSRAEVCVCHSDNEGGISIHSKCHPELVSGSTASVDGMLKQVQHDNMDRDPSSARASLGMTKRRKELTQKLKEGDINIVVGTHALLTAGVDFKKLGLVVVDEQHRFGVEQRKLIKAKSASALRATADEGRKAAHFLSMTATPIPRSLALMLYGDLDVSIINELPPGRKKIITKLVEPAKRDKAYQFIREQVKQGRQIFVVCPLIENESQLVIPSERSDEESLSQLSNGQGSLLRRRDDRLGVRDDSRFEKKSVLSEYEKLSRKIFPDLKIGFLHGKLKPKEKEETMSKFKTGEIDLLVSTSVVEVGVDIPNASIMMIEGAESFGLAQLHQFRGRVGRSVHQSYCFLFTGATSARTLERLQYFEQVSDGFKLAEKDLAMRGPGEVYGTEQSGEINLRLAKLTDRELIKKAREAAKTVVANLDNYAEVLTKVKNWENRVHLE